MYEWERRKLHTCNELGSIKKEDGGAENRR
jgi:hypothetical protein